jgi:hypothetical protein
LFYLECMRALFSISVFLLMQWSASAQEFVAPASFNLYPDSIAVYLKLNNPDQKINLRVRSAFGDQHFETNITDTVVMVPYYTLYDDERLLVMSLEPDWGRKNYSRQLDEQVIKLATIKKTDSLESAIYRVMENPSEKHLVALARGFEQQDCYGNALYVYYKLYRKGYRKYWIDFITRNTTRRIRMNNVHR